MGCCVSREEKEEWEKTLAACKAGEAVNIGHDYSLDSGGMHRTAEVCHRRDVVLQIVFGAASRILERFRYFSDVRISWRHRTPSVHSH